ncbi:uncharacterized protein LOC117113747 [Anneissia japonica]|uniref:uncharacterized protein LOC117113747 n=1 Tax=Anneissia japonica TaxID=1529436 RepID=UPI0014258926|nr:uncharacterized protein LOC117113747 [Anneissia japonica]
MDREDELLRSQYQTLKDLGLFNEPIERYVSRNEDDGYLCDTQQDSKPNQVDYQGSPKRYDSEEYLCDTQDNARAFYHSPPRSPVNDFRFKSQQSDDDNGYTSPDNDSDNDDDLRPHSPNHAYDSDERTSSLTHARHFPQSYTSPECSPLQPRRNSKATSSSVINDDLDEEDLYSPSADNDPAFDAKLIHRAVGLDPFPVGKTGLPINWTESALAFHKVVELHAGNLEFNQIYSTIDDAGITVENIERIENKSLLDKFLLEIDHMKKRRKCSDEDLNIVYLFHGTCAKKEVLTEEGLDQRLARPGHFGRGIYFSDNPRKCMEYIMRKKKEGQSGYIIMCRVLLGHVKIYDDGKQDKTLLREPEIEQSKQRYDSVKGRVSAYAEYVTYTNSRALPEYFITVETNSDTYKSNRSTVKETRPKKPPETLTMPKPTSTSSKEPPTKVKPKPKPKTALAATAAVSSPTDTKRMSPCLNQTITTEGQVRPTTTSSDMHAKSKSTDMPLTWGKITDDEFENKIAKLRATLRKKKMGNASPKAGDFTP